MFGCFLNVTVDKVRYKNIVGEEQDVEILISPSSIIEDNEVSKGLPKLKIFFYSFSIITLLIFFMALGILYYSPHILTDSRNTFWEHSLQPLSDNTMSCTPFDLVRDVIVVTEISNFTSCSDNKTCHSFLDVIEQEHDGMNYNFVIGHRGELYIGAGFKCLVNKEKSALYVKLLKHQHLNSSEDSEQMFLRLGEIINHGLMCGKISLGYKILDEEEVNYAEVNQTKAIFNIKPHHVHDPNHEVKLIHGNFGWTVCGNYSSAMNVSKERVITWENLPEKSCLPLKIVDEIIVDVEETSPFDCSDDLSCRHFFEEHHDGLNYNFIIGHTNNIYIGLGFNCKADNSSDDSLKIKVLVPPGKDYYNNGVFSKEHITFSEIIEEGLNCRKISEDFSVKVNCSISDSSQYSLCEEAYQLINNTSGIKYLTSYSENYENHYNISSEQGRIRQLVPVSYSLQFCHNKPTIDTTTSVFETDSSTPVFETDSTTPVFETDSTTPVFETVNFTPETEMTTSNINTYVDYDYYYGDY